MRDLIPDEHQGIMIDTETLGLSPRALPWQVAWCDLPTGATKCVLLNPAEMRAFSGAFEDSHHARKFNIKNNKHAQHWLYAYDSGATLRYTPEMRDEGIEIVSIETLHKMLTDALEPTAQVWFKNVAFDAPILANLFGIRSLQNPWHRSKQGCLYTLTMLFDRLCPDIILDSPPYPQNGHDAAVDAKHQSILYWEMMGHIMDQTA